MIPWKQSQTSGGNLFAHLHQLFRVFLSKTFPICYPISQTGISALQGLLYQLVVPLSTRQYGFGSLCIR